jgi:mannitol-specific phosphotransferase system IIBC component
MEIVQIFSPCFLFTCLFIKNKKQKKKAKNKKQKHNTKNKKQKQKAKNKKQKQETKT